MAPTSSLPALDTAAANDFGGVPSILSASTQIDVSSPNTTVWQHITNLQHVLNAWKAEHSTRNLEMSVEEPPNEAYLCQPNKEYLFLWTATLSVASTMLNDLLHVYPIEKALFQCHQCDSAMEARFVEIGTQLEYVLIQHLSSISPNDLIQDQGITIPQLWTCFVVMVLGTLIGNTCSMDTPMMVGNDIRQFRLPVHLFMVRQHAGKITMIFQHTQANTDNYGLHSITKVTLDVKAASSFQKAGIFWDPDDLQALRRLDDFAGLLEKIKHMAEGSVQVLSPSSSNLEVTDSHGSESARIEPDERKILHSTGCSSQHIKTRGRTFDLFLHLWKLRYDISRTGRMDAS